MVRSVTKQFSIHQITVSGEALSTDKVAQKKSFWTYWNAGNVQKSQYIIKGADFDVKKVFLIER